MRFGKTGGLATGLAGALALGSIGCHSDNPHDYGQERPSVSDLDSRDKGLQSRDIVEAADKMAAELLSNPDLNASHEQWTIVTGKMDDQTHDPQFRNDYDIFLQALRSRLAKEGRGRVTLIINRDKFYQMRDKELEGNGRDPFGQGDGSGRGAPGATNPDYQLDGTVRALKNRGTIYYSMEFALNDLKRRTQPWVGQYDVKVAR